VSSNYLNHNNLVEASEQRHTLTMHKSGPGCILLCALSDSIV